MGRARDEQISQLRAWPLSWCKTEHPVGARYHVIVFPSGAKDELTVDALRQGDDLYIDGIYTLGNHAAIRSFCC